MNSEDFKQQIRSKDYFIYERNFKKFQEDYRMTVPLGAPAYLSIDFYGRQSAELRKRGFYIVRTGRGGFVIFDEKSFPKPYLDLSLENCEEIECVVPKGFEELVGVFRKNMNEDSSLEMLDVCGVYGKIITEIARKKRYHTGIRGNKTSEFDVYFRRRDKKEPEFIFRFCGQEELDFSLCTDSDVFVVEAKDLQGEQGLDLGWHKLAYPSSRFYGLNMNIVPIYFLKLRSTVYLFVFPNITFYKKGLVLNDPEQLKPIRKYKVDLQRAVTSKEHDE